MKSLTILFLFISLNGLSQINTSYGVINSKYVEVYLFDYDRKLDAHIGYIDDGNNMWSQILDENNQVIWFTTPVHLKNFMKSMGYSYVNSETYVTYIPNANWYTVRIFKR